MGYRITDQENGTIKVNGVWLAPNTKEEEALCSPETIINNVSLKVSTVEGLEAYSDAGPAFKDVDFWRYEPITSEDIVWDGTEAVGIFCKEHLFLFDRPYTHSFEDVSYGRSTGSGDSYSGYLYELIKKV